jgi:hypothetical protein
MSFDAFWSLYPRKVGKKPAREVWERLVRRGVDSDAIMAGLRQYLADKPEWQHWCHPVTFLRQERWNDLATVEARAASGRRFCGNLELPDDIPDWSLPVAVTMESVLWLLPDGSKAERPRFPKRVRPDAGGHPAA